MVQMTSTAHGGGAFRNRKVFHERTGTKTDFSILAAIMSITADGGCWPRKVVSWHIELRGLLLSY